MACGNRIEFLFTEMIALHLDWTSQVSHIPDSTDEAVPITSQKTTRNNKKEIFKKNKKWVCITFHYDTSMLINMITK